MTLDRTLRERPLLLWALALGSAALAVVAVRTWHPCTRISLESGRSTCLEELLESELDPEILWDAASRGPDAESRDLLRLRILVLRPGAARELCPSFEGEVARQWCLDLKERAHLWRGPGGMVGGGS